ncbi:MAG: YqaA family protein [Sphingomonadales bacterium]
MLTRLYDWTMHFAGHKRAVMALVLISFVESSIFPIPPDVLLIPMVLAARDRAFLYAGVCTASSVVGGFAGYAIGFYLFDAWGRPLMEFYGYVEQFMAFQVRYNEWGAWIVAFFGLTPFPYKVITIASGVTNLDIFTFTAASILSRGVRFFLVAALLWRFGQPIRRFIEQRLGLLTVIFFVALFGAFVVLKYL